MYSDDAFERSLIERAKSRMIREPYKRYPVTAFGFANKLANLFDEALHERVANPAAQVLSAPNPPREAREHMGIKVARANAARHPDPRTINPVRLYDMVHMVVKDDAPVRESGTRNQERSRRLLAFLREN